MKVPSATFQGPNRHPPVIEKISQRRPPLPVSDKRFAAGVQIPSFPPRFRLKRAASSGEKMFNLRQQLLFASLRRRDHPLPSRPSGLVAAAAVAAALPLSHTRKRKRTHTHTHPQKNTHPDSGSVWKRAKCVGPIGRRPSPNVIYSTRDREQSSLPVLLLPPQGATLTAEGRARSSLNFGAAILQREEV